MSKRWMQTLACGVAALFAAAPAFAADTIKLGVAGAHSGELASYGTPSLNAAMLVAEEFNARGGVMGKQVEIVAQDDLCKAEVATAAATKLISDGVAAVMGHICSGPCKATLPLYTNANMISMSPSATTPSLTQSGQNPTFFRTIANDNDSAVVGAKFIVEALKLDKVAILHDNSEYGRGYAEKAREELEKSGKTQVVLFEAVTPGATDYSSAVRKVAQSRAQALMWGGYYPEAAKILSNMYTAGVEIPMVGSDSFQGYWHQYGGACDTRHDGREPEGYGLCAAGRRGCRRRICFRSHGYQRQSSERVLRREASGEVRNRARRVL